MQGYNKVHWASMEMEKIAGKQQSEKRSIVLTCQEGCEHKGPPFGTLPGLAALWFVYNELPAEGERLQSAHFHAIAASIPSRSCKSFVHKCIAIHCKEAEHPYVILRAATKCHGSSALTFAAGNDFAMLHLYAGHTSDNPRLRALSLRSSLSHRTQV